MKKKTMTVFAFLEPPQTVDGQKVQGLTFYIKDGKLTQFITNTLNDQSTLP